jgi:membrane protein implicated in regulation of membrane protease activity
MHPLDIVYWTCLLLGGVYMGFNLLMGGVTHVIGHAHGGGGGEGAGHIAGHDGGAGHIAGHDGGAGHAVDAGGHAGPSGHSLEATHGHHGHDGGHLEHDGGVEEGIGRASLLAYINPMTLMGLLVGVGGGGVLSRLGGAGVGSSLLFAAGGGASLYYTSWWIICRFFGGAQSSSHGREQDICGIVGKVTAPIMGQSAGTVCITHMGARQSFRAVADGDELIAVGASVRVRRVEKGTAHVIALDG